MSMDGVLRQLQHWLRRVLDVLRRVPLPGRLRTLLPRADHASSPDEHLASDPDAESEFSMADPNPKDQPQDEQLSPAADDAAASPASGANQADDLDATLASMQSELEGLTDMIAGEGETEVDTYAAADESAGDGAAPDADEPASAADDIASFENDDATAAVDGDALPDHAADVPDEAMTDAPVADPEPVPMAEADDAEVEALLADVEAPSDAALSAAAPEPPAEASTPVDDEAQAEVYESASHIAAAGASAAGSGWKDEMSADAVREAAEPFPATRGRPRTQRRPERTVESAIQGLAAFLQGEVNGAWNDARDALEEILTYRDEIRRTAKRIGALHRELHAMREDIVSARREARTIQTQMQNLRDDAARARQRSDAAALDAQSSADRAVAAAREAESAVNITREI